MFIPRTQVDGKKLSSSLKYVVSAKITPRNTYSTFPLDMFRYDRAYVPEKEPFLKATAHLLDLGAVAPMQGIVICKFSETQKSKNIWNVDRWASHGWNIDVDAVLSWRPTNYRRVHSPLTHLHIATLRPTSKDDPYGRPIWNGGFPLWEMNQETIFPLNETDSSKIITALETDEEELDATIEICAYSGNSLSPWKYEVWENSGWILEPTPQ